MHFDVAMANTIDMFHKSADDYIRLKSKYYPHVDNFDVIMEGGEMQISPKIATYLLLSSSVGKPHIWSFD